MEASETSSVDLLKEMRKIKGGKKDRPDLPETVGDATGEDLIVDRFREVYENLYNSWETSAELAELKREIFSTIDDKMLMKLGR